MVDAKRVGRINVWPTHELAAQAGEAAESDDCKISHKLTVWQTQEQAAANTNLDDEGEGGDVLAPTITSANTNSVAENATLSHALTADEAVTWSIVGGADQARFELSGSTLRWLSNGTKDYETPDDAGTNNAYVVTIRATDLADNFTDQTITVTVTDVDDTAPTITSSNSGTVAENATLSHALTANEAVTWSLNGGADVARFELSGSTLRWASNGTKNFESPNDANTDNAYVVTVRATDTAGNGTDQTITYTVTSVNEAPTSISWAGSHAVDEGVSNGTVVGGALSFGDPDAGDSGAFTLDDSAGGKFAISGTSIQVNGALDYETAASHSITVRFTDAGGLSTTQEFTVTVNDVTERSVTDALPLFITADIDPANERDDESAVALWLATQEYFSIVGLVADAPDGDKTQFNNQSAAMRQDLQKLKVHSPYPQRFKTAIELDAVTVQGANSDAPAVGYRVSGDSQYAQSHAAAQALIAAAVANGSVGGGPRDKLWVAVQGGWVTIAQACYEAIQLGEQPDFLKRIRIVGQPNYNSWAAPNAWNYLTANCYASAGVPGLFGDLWALCGYFKWHAHNRDNNGTDATFWASVISYGAMGAFLEAERIVSDWTADYFRAGDAGAWFWLINAFMLDDFDPESTANPAGPYQTYIGELWAAQTFGYGAGSGIGTGNPNPEHTGYSPTMWAPPLTVDDNTTAAVASVVIADWYAQAGEAMQRYDAATDTSTSLLYMAGDRYAAFELTGAPSTGEDTNLSFSLSWIGPAIVDPVTVTFSEADEENIVGTLADSLAAAVQTGVTSAGNTLIIDGTATSPVTILRTPDDTIDGTRFYTLEIASVSDGGFVQDPVTTEILDVSEDLVNAEAIAYIARMSVTPDGARQLLIDNLFTSLKAIGLAKFAGMMLLGHTEQASLLDLVRTSTSWTNTGSAFTTDVGFLTDGTDDFIDSGYNPTGGGGVYAQNSAHMAFWNTLNSTISHASPVMAANDDGAAPNVQLNPRGNTGNFTYRINDATSGTLGSQTINIGLTAVNRKAASGTNARQIYRDGVSLQGTTTASTGLPDANIWAGRSNVTYSARRFVFLCFGSSLTDAEHADLYTALNTYLTAIGAV